MIQVLNVWLNDGAGSNGARILQPSSVDLAFQNHIPSLSDSMDEPV